MGRGAGHYDRLLPRLRSDTVCWALCLSCQLIPRLPIEPHDRPLNGISAPGRHDPGRAEETPIAGPVQWPIRTLRIIDIDQSARTSTAGGLA